MDQQHPAGPEVQQDCPHHGCWWQKRDIARRVLSFLTSNVGVLTCDMVCIEWRRLKAPLPQMITLDRSEVDMSAQSAWITNNIGRIKHITLRADDAAMSANLAAATALQSLVVSECSTLQQLPVGCGGLSQLTSLHFDRCPHINALPEDLGLLTGLQSLRLQGTPTSLAVIPDSISALGQLRDLRLHGCHLIQEIPDVVGCLTSLTRLELDTDCDAPEVEPTMLMPRVPSHLTSISSNISQLTGLQHLTIRGAQLLSELPDVFGAFGGLLELKLIGLHALTTLPDSVGELHALTCLVLHGANSLESMPEALGGLNCLKHFSIAYCNKLTSIPLSISELDSLEHLVLGCHSLLQVLPDTLGGLTALTHLSIETASLTELPESIGNLASLRELVLNYCHCLQGLPSSIGNLPSLELLCIDTCMHLTTLPESLTQLSTLTHLRIHNGEAWPVQLPPLPAGIGNMPRLRKLTLTSAHPTGSCDFRALPASLAGSTSLQELHWGDLQLRRA